jgi:hypothetical protein
MSAHQSLIWLPIKDKSWQHNNINLTMKQTMSIPLACHIYCLPETDKWQIFVQLHPSSEVWKYPRVGKCVSILPSVGSLWSVEVRPSVSADTHSTLNDLCFLCDSFSTTWKHPSSLTSFKRTEDLSLSACRTTRGVRRRRRRWWWYAFSCISLLCDWSGRPHGRHLPQAAEVTSWVAGGGAGGDWYLKKNKELSSLFCFLLFCTMTNKCTIISQIITLLHVSTLSRHPRGACQVTQVFQIELLVMQFTIKIFYIRFMHVLIL